MVNPKNGFKYFLYTINGLLYLVTAALWTIIPEMVTLNVCTALVTISLSMILIIIDRNRFRKYYESPQFYKFISVAISGFLIFSILVVINYLFYKHPFKGDFSKLKNNSLTTETISILKQIDGELRFKIFARKNEILAIKTLLDLYRFEKNDIQIDQVDVELRPDLVKKYGVYKSGTIQIDYNNRTDQVMESSELAITNSILRLTREKDPVIMFTEGHGELSLSNKNKEGISKIGELLQKAYFKIITENTLQLFEIKDEVDLVVIWGAKNAFMGKELQLLENYLGRGGKLLVAIDPSFTDDRLKDLREMVSRFGIQIKNNIVIDQISFVDGSNGSVPLINKIKSKNPVLRSLTGPIFFPLVSGINSSADYPKKEFEVSFGLETGHFPASWADNTPAEMMKGSIKYNMNKDERGPIHLFGMSKGTLSDAKLIAFGNSSFISNAYEKYGRNYNLFMNSISWLTRKGEIDAFNLPLGKNEPVFLNRYQVGIVFYFSVLFLPVIFGILAIFFYKRKRKL